MIFRCLWAGFAAGIFFSTLALTASGADADLRAALDSLKRTGVEGKGHGEAAAAWKVAGQSPASALPVILRAMEGSGPLAENWIATVADQVAERALEKNEPLPLAGLGEILFERKLSGRVRRLAYDLILRADAKLAEELLPGFLTDPAAELRREAVQRIINQGTQRLEAQQTNTARLYFEQALGFAREGEQVELLVKRLREQGQTVDVPSLFGWLRRWHVIGPFDNRERKGFESVFAPETKVDLSAELQGLAGAVRWQSIASTNDFGIVDLNAPFGKLKEATAYAFAEVESPTARNVELRLGTKNAWKLWFNERFVFGRDEYHFGMEIDQFRYPVVLKAGRNRILVKLCQNEQKEDWTVEWEFQLRICDPDGSTLHFPGLAASVSSAELKGNP